jgi:hypothetical protein
MILPCKDSIEKLLLPDAQNLTEKQNLLCTFVLVSFVFVITVGIANISDVIVVVSATACTWIGFNLPMIFYLKLYQIENGNKWGYQRILAHGVNLALVGLSVYTLA